MLTKEEKKEILKNTEKTGGVEAQVLLLSREIEELFAHLKENPKDLHSKRGLLGMVNKRKKLLTYLKKKDEERYKELIKEIGLKK